MVSINLVQKTSFPTHKKKKVKEQGRTVIREGNSGYLQRLRMAKSKKILMFTNSDYGQANVALATAHALMHAAAHVEVHLASFHGLEGAVKETSDFARKTAPGNSAAQPLIFHPLDGISWGPASFRPEVGMAEAYDLTPGLVNSAKNVLVIPAIMLPWRPSEFVAIYREAERVLNQVKPDLTVVDPLFTPGLTLCHHLGINWVVLAPNTVKDFAVPAQPRLAMLWKYPLYVFRPVHHETSVQLGTHQGFNG